MVWYYCEFCNKNVNVSTTYNVRPRCSRCSRPLYYQNLSQQEIRRRDAERTTYCENCNQMMYSLPTTFLIKEIREHGDVKLFQIHGTKRKNIYKFLAPLFWAFSVLFLFYMIILIINPSIGEYSFVVYLITSPVCVGIGFIFWKLKDRRNIKNQKIDQQIQEKQKDIEGYIAQIQEKQFLYVCNQCFNGVVLHKKAPSHQDRIREASTESTVYCEKCGFSNNIESKFCTSCGYSLENIRAIITTRSRHIPSQVRYEVYHRDRGQCVQCKSRDNIQFDHVIPFSKGGAHSVENIQVLCQRCNSEKSDKIQ